MAFAFPFPDWGPVITPLVISLVIFGLAALFVWIAVRNGQVYAMGNPIIRKREPAKFWVFVTLICSPFLILGLFFFQVIFR